MSDLPRLFHGTSIMQLPKIERFGVKTSRELGAATYPHLRPTTDYVYLSSYRAFRYAIYRSSKDFVPFEELGFTGFRGIALIELDAAALDLNNLRPDDDLYTQLVGDLPKPTEEIDAAVEWMEANPQLWAESIERYGTVAHRGTIPPSAFKKIAVFVQRPDCGLNAFLNSFCKINQESAWRELEAKHWLLLQAVMGEGVKIEDLMDVDHIREGGSTPEMIQWVFDRATIIVKERNEQGEWASSFLGDHSMMMPTPPQ